MGGEDTAALLNADPELRALAAAASQAAEDKGVPQTGALERQDPVGHANSAFKHRRRRRGARLRIRAGTCHFVQQNMIDRSMTKPEFDDHYVGKHFDEQPNRWQADQETLWHR